MTILERRPALIYVYVTLAWLVLHACSWNTANWSFGDDFAYALPVQQMLKTGEMHYTNWSSMTLVLQVWLGAGLSSLMGFSFDHLRLLSVLSHLSFILAFCAIAGRMKLHPWWTVLAALLLLFQPLIVELSLCFDTDLPFLGILMWSVYFFLRYVQDSRLLDYVLGMVLCVAAFFIRDLALVIAAAFALTLVLRERWSSRSIALALTSVVVMSVAYLSWRWWLGTMHGLPASIDYSRHRMIETWTHPSLVLNSYSRNFLYATCYMGLWMLPVAVAVLVRSIKQRKTSEIVLALVYASLCSVALFISPRALQEASDQLLNQFVPYADLANVYRYVHDPLPTPPSWSIAVVLVLACLSAGVVVSHILCAFHSTSTQAEGSKPSLISIILLRSHRNPEKFLFLSIILIYSILISSQWILHRYYLPLLPFVFLITIQSLSKHEWRPAPGTRRVIFVLSAVLMYSGLANGHDFMAHQHAMVQMYEYAETVVGTDANHLDGGFSYNSLRNYDYSYVAQPSKNWWWVHGDDYVIGEAPMLGLTEIHRIEYSRWLPPGINGTIILHQHPASR